MIYFTRGDYSRPGKVKLDWAPPGMGSRLDPIRFVDELRAEVQPHEPVLVGPFAVHSAVVIWLSKAGFDVREPSAAQR